MGKGSFSTTRWTMVLRARRDGDDEAREALAELCRTYWYPVYFYVRRSGHDPDAAIDLAQDFFLFMMERDSIQRARPEIGRFRSFLIGSLKHFLSNVRRSAAAEKRGGRVAVVSLDGDEAENRYRLEPADLRTPDTAYERSWALAVLERTRERLAADFRSKGKVDQFELLAPHLTGSAEALGYGEIAEQLQTTEAAVKMAVSRLRKRYGQALREEIGQTVDEPLIDDEVRHLLQVLQD